METPIHDNPKQNKAHIKSKLFQIRNPYALHALRRKAWVELNKKAESNKRKCRQKVDF